MDNPFDLIEKRFDKFESLLTEILSHTSASEKPLEKLLSPEETCKLFQPSISKVTLWNWTNEGKLQKHQIGGKVFYKYSEVMESITTLKKYKK